MKKVTLYYHAHITYGEDKIIVGSDGQLIDYEYLKTYPKVDFNQMVIRLYLILHRNR